MRVEVAGQLRMDCRPAGPEILYKSILDDVLVSHHKSILDDVLVSHDDVN
jgi:hypothetical protein